MSKAIMFNVFGFYKFIKLRSLKKNKAVLQNLLKKLNIKGTIIISEEGLNGTIAGKSKNLITIKKKIKNLLKVENFDSENISKCKFQPFHRPKVKIKNEANGMEMDYMIVADGEADLASGKLSVNSPIGKGLLGKSVGDTAEISVPNGKIRFKILQISR